MHLILISDKDKNIAYVMNTMGMPIDLDLDHNFTKEDIAEYLEDPELRDSFNKEDIAESLEDPEITKLLSKKAIRELKEMIK